MDRSRSFFDLYVKSPIVAFAATERDQFEDRLRALAATTQLRPIESPLELQLDEAGRTIRGGLKLSAVAFRKICSMVATSAYSFLPELSGQVKTARNDEDLVDG